jgi:hypothetical protein
MLSFTNRNIFPLSLRPPLVPVNTCMVDLLSLALARTASSTSLQLPLLTTCHWGTTLLYMKIKPNNLKVLTFLNNQILLILMSTSDDSPA